MAHPFAYERNATAIQAALQKCRGVCCDWQIKSISNKKCFLEYYVFKEKAHQAGR